MFIARTVARAAPVAQLARSYATAPAAQAVKVPLSLHGIEGRYATALYSAAVKKNQLEAVERDLSSVAAALKKDAELKFSLESPMVNKHQKKALVAKSFKGINETTKNFFDVLAENGRLDQTTKVLASFTELMGAHRKEVSVTVISAKELDSSTSKKLQTILSKSNLIEKDAKLIVNNKIDASILGGLVIDFGDKTIDLSVASKINKLNRLLTEAI
ncbi:ATP synthase F0 subcomplex subunit OSCP atp5 [Geranomyces variabilis]|uniref:ATP synthase subunit 5, mitochondrial n=1 Tax=Geranomyces variabilis TaxID=109894 RepID=A0AAD5XMQ5_9FUNG|nr:ATP synthase F0 subcomplex subunit OSCP atp5 [Geranomyces variabilis]